MIGTIAGQQVLSLRRQRILTVLFVSFVLVLSAQRLNRGRIPGA